MKANGRKPKSCLDQVFNFKLDYVDLMHDDLVQGIQKIPNLELKPQPRFCPVSETLTML
jgi:hypothetical protein